MDETNNSILLSTNEAQHPSIRKLQGIAILMRAASAGYAAWVLWNILNWWLDSPMVVRNFGNFVHRDLTGLGAGQRFGALALDLIAWTLLLLSVVQCWKFLHDLSRPMRWNHIAAGHITRCAWFALACEVMTLLSRPLQSFLITAHLPIAEHVWKWSFRAVDLQAVLFCLALLMFAYVFTWTMELVEENRSFI